jgi:hypothetical protein
MPPFRLFQAAARAGSGTLLVSVAQRAACRTRRGAAIDDQLSDLLAFAGRSG